MNIQDIIVSMTQENMLNQLRDRYAALLKNLLKDGVYIWGTGRLGQFAHEQCIENNIRVKGFIDNDASRWNDEKHVFSCDILAENDVIILATFYYPDVIKQLEHMGTNDYIYYEELAYLVEGLDTYSCAFADMYEELENNRQSYREVYDLMADSLSREIYTNVLMYRCTLDIKYTQQAHALSAGQGTADFDRLIVERLNEKYTFYDVGGYDGESTVEFLLQLNKYQKIYFFEPDSKNMETAKERLKSFDDITFVRAGVGEHRGIERFNALGGLSGTFSEDGNENVDIVTLDDYVDSHYSYIKMDVEGYELAVLKGAEQCIKRYKPMLSVSVYHIPGDIHRLTKLILQWNPKYKVYMRHYTDIIADTRVYFIDN